MATLNETELNQLAALRTQAVAGQISRVFNGNLSITEKGFL